MHLDMKPENILCVTRTGNRIKLIDFGLARRFDPNKTLQVMFGTPDFASPEVLSYDRVTPAADMWSVGVICYVLLSGLSPFMGNSDLETMTNVTKAIYDFDDDSFDPISEEAKDFISKLLIKDPKRRLKPSDCLKHKWLAQKVPVKAATKLSKTKLKKYVVRRRWQKAVTAIMALRRMGANLSLANNSLVSPSSARMKTSKGGSGVIGTKTATSSTSSSITKSSTKGSTPAPKTRTISSTTSATSKTLTTSSVSRTAKPPPVAITSVNTASGRSSGFSSSSYSTAKSTSSSSSSYRVSSSSSSSSSRRY